MKYIIVFISFFAFNCSNSKLDGEKFGTEKIEIDIYSYSGFNNSLRLELLSDGRFISDDNSFRCFGGGERKKVWGGYTMDSINLTLIPERIEFTEYSGIELKPKTTNLKYGIDSLKIKTDLKVVTWGNNKYLFSDLFDVVWSLEKDYLRFAEYLNSGLEPKSSGMYLALKAKGSINSDFDLGQIPKKWEGYYLKKPISSKIKSIKKVVDPNDAGSISWQIELDKGAKDRMNNRLTLQSQVGSFFIDIDSVLTNKSFGITYLHVFSAKRFPIGTELRTKWE